MRSCVLIKQEQLLTGRSFNFLRFKANQSHLWSADLSLTDHLPPNYPFFRSLINFTVIHVKISPSCLHSIHSYLRYTVNSILHLFLLVLLSFIFSSLFFPLSLIQCCLQSEKTLSLAWWHSNSSFKLPLGHICTFLTRFWQTLEKMWLRSFSWTIWDPSWTPNLIKMWDALYVL